jgi:putative tryptophan/tyrosine transport system substrate-binding protein
MRRREFITLIGGAVIWPIAARAQQPIRMKRIGLLVAETATVSEPNIAVFRMTLSGLGHPDAVLDVRFADGRVDRLPALAFSSTRLALD